MTVVTELLNTALATADETCPVREVFFDLHTRRIEYLALEIGGWFDSDEVLVSADLVGPPAGQGAPWTVSLDHGALDNAPRWHEGMREDMVDLSAWPPVIVGPFGGTYAPILLYEQLFAGFKDDPAPTPDEDRLVTGMERATAWIGLPVFGLGGELGRVADLRFDPATRRISTFLLARNDPESDDPVEYPMSAVHLTRQKTHLVMEKDGSTV